MSSNINIPDVILAREAGLMFEKGRGFEPFNGDLTRWRGLIPGRGQFRDRYFTVEIQLLDGFPAVPPLVRMISEVDHPRVGRGGVVDLWILKRWNPQYHLFQVANSLKGLFAREPLRPARHLIERGAAPKVKPDAALEVLTRQKAQLEEVLRQKEADLSRMRAALSGRRRVDPTKERQEYLEKRKLSLEEELFDIEERFHWADISSVDFAKEYLRIRTQLQLIALQS
ncbi:hypothetical protein DRO91_00570 [Candidatus Heimdallarchaeota archaeon]|nr:MAG: hypothetical protein DRP02_01010 [Candidatus Gerdarchaeota archaeon]RLI74422.1 MAG: hypothetical protein DRO91_00570 [Candidatus Heimdallarchaeota archaeon]